MRSAACALLPTNGASPPPAENEGSKGEVSEGKGSEGEGEGREASPLATSTTALEDSTASAEDDGGEAPDVEDTLAADGDRSHKRDALQMLLLFACKRGDPKSLRENLMNGTSADFIDADGHSPLFYAVAHGHVECVKVLLDAKAPLDPKLVCYAVEFPSILSLLLDANASPNGSDKVQPPLIIAGMRGQSESMQMLLDAGARCDSDWPEDAAYPAWARLSMMLDQTGVVIDQWQLSSSHISTLSLSFTPASFYIPYHFLLFVFHIYGCGGDRRTQFLRPFSVGARTPHIELVRPLPFLQTIAPG